MRILVTANLTPFLHGGADYHIEGLVTALRTHGHEVECLRLPFQFHPLREIERLMDFCANLDLASPNGMRIDRLVSLQFPGWGMSHPDHVIWLMHQHRAVYELYEPRTADPALARLKERIHAYDSEALARGRTLYANSRRVAQRLKAYNGLDAQPLYHPPHHAERFYSAPPDPYIFYPSRLESLKRQDLLIEAARRTKSPVAFLVAGEGGQAERYRALVERHQLQDKVRFLGRISEAEKLAFYARAQAVFFGPFDEDYGYVTLEAMLSSKPVLTCADSGGPLEFVIDGQTGWVCPPDPEALAERIDWLHANPKPAADMGRAGRSRYDDMGIDWRNVVNRLTA